VSAAVQTDAPAVPATAAAPAVAAVAMRLRLDVWPLNCQPVQWTADLYREDNDNPADEGLPEWQGGYHPQRELAEAEARAWAQANSHRVVA
jgi:hypothetical protein